MARLSTQPPSPAAVASSITPAHPRPAPCTQARLRDALEHVGLERHVLLQRLDAAPRLRQLLLALRHQLLLGLRWGWGQVRGGRAGCFSWWAEERSSWLLQPALQPARCPFSPSRPSPSAHAGGLGQLHAFRLRALQLLLAALQAVVQLVQAAGGGLFGGWVQERAEVAEASKFRCSRHALRPPTTPDRPQPRTGAAPCHGPCPASGAPPPWPPAPRPAPPPWRRAGREVVGVGEG